MTGFGVKSLKGAELSDDLDEIANRSYQSDPFAFALRQMQHQANMIQMMTNMMKQMHDTAGAVIQNIK